MRNPARADSACACASPWKSNLPSITNASTLTVVRLHTPYESRRISAHGFSPFAFGLRRFASSRLTKPGSPSPCMIVNKRLSISRVGFVSNPTELLLMRL
jgi:hypothetical protein